MKPMRYISIFTDASITTSSFGETIGCAGAICEEDNNICDYEILRDSTNNISEITAIKLAVQLAIKNRHMFKDCVHIYADSQWAIYGLTKWIRSWTDNTINGILYNSSKEPVKNQQIFLSIIKLIVDNRLPVKFYHVKGHVDTNNINSIEKAVTVFSRSNNVLVFNKNRIVDISYMNNMVDNNTRNLLKTFNVNNRVYYNRGIINPIISNEDLNIYYNLVTLGGNPI